MTEKDVRQSFLYKTINFCYKALNRLIVNFTQAARDLNYLLYQMRFGEREDDIYVVSYPKSGTTKMQMMLYQLTTGGDMDFEHIDDVSPWLKNDAFEKKPDKQLPSPRIIKSHEEYDSFDKETKGRIVYVYRDGRDVAVSKYHQDKNYQNPDLTFDDFMKGFFKKGKSHWFGFHKKWMENKKGLKVLYVAYEEMKGDPEVVIKKISDFFEVTVSEAVKQLALEHSSFEFMKQHEDKFGVKPQRKVYDNFIRKGKSGEWQTYFSDAHIKEFELQQKEYFENS